MTATRLILGGIVSLIVLAAYGAAWIAVLVTDLAQAKDDCDREREW